MPISGHVYCICDTNTIAGALVQLEDEFRNTYSATTDTNGAYALNVPSGDYTATISGNLYFPMTTNVTVAPCMPTNDFYLTNLTLVINPLFDATITGNANAQSITNTIKSAIKLYSQDIANPLCVTVLFSTTTDPNDLGTSAAAYNTISYAEYLTALQANPYKSANDVTALATLPPGLAPASMATRRSSS